ncbi:MAG: PrsW family intramembrane metalloprotease [Anaerolineae bacterium]|nr:PrsW family intramembrane metalloprotease [Anaerolineae bacterium]
MSTSGYLIPPPTDTEEVRFRQAVWRRIVIEQIIVVVIAGGLFVAVNFIGIKFPPTLNRVAGILIALAPLGLWLLLSWQPERHAVQPRHHLLSVAVISALSANAIGIPLTNDFFQVDRWLPLSSAINRIIGYTFTVGITYELLKYLVVRYLAWSDDFNVRSDGIAYGTASAIGFASVLNLQFIITNNPSVDVVALQVFETLSLHVATSLIVGYALAELRFGRPSPLLMPASVALAALVNGIAIPLRAGLVNASLGLETSLPKPLLGLGFAIALLVIVMFIISFLLRGAEKQALEVSAGR